MTLFNFVFLIYLHIYNKIINMPRSNSAKLIADTNAITGSFFGIQATEAGATTDEIMFRGEAKTTTNIALPTGSIVEAEFTELKLATGAVIAYVQSTD